MTAAISLDVENNANCGLKVHWGDGATQDIKVTDKAAIPYKATHAYAKGGDYQVMIEPKRVTSHLKCGGKNVTAAYKVVAAPVAAAPAGAASAAVKAGQPALKAGAGCEEREQEKPALMAAPPKREPYPREEACLPRRFDLFGEQQKGMLGCKP